MQLQEKLRGRGSSVKPCVGLGSLCEECDSPGKSLCFGVSPSVRVLHQQGSHRVSVALFCMVVKGEKRVLEAV